MIYASEGAAIRRVQQLQRLGIWPGYFRCSGGWRLTFDPADTTELDSHGYLMGQR